MDVFISVLWTVGILGLLVLMGMYPTISLFFIFVGCLFGGILGAVHTFRKDLRDR